MEKSFHPLEFLLVGKIFYSLESSSVVNLHIAAWLIDVCYVYEYSKQKS